MSRGALRLAVTPLDGLLLILVLIWGSNFSIVKIAIEEIPAFGFNALRITTACVVLLSVSRLTGEGVPARRDSPLQLSAYATLVGTLCYVPFGVPDLLRLDWGGVSGWAWVALVVSGLLALSVAHIIWYTGVKRLGSAHTSVYSNLVPVAAMAVAFVWLSEPIGAARIGGATLVLTGLLLTRVQQTTARA